MTTSDIKNVTKQTEISGKAQFDWNRLPPELKCHCIKKMDFKARTGLRCSSKTERRLVDSLGKNKFDEVSLSLVSSELGTSINLLLDSDRGDFLDERSLRRNIPEKQNFENFVSFLKQVLTCDITCLELEVFKRNDHESFLDVFTNGSVLSVEKLALCSRPIDFVIPILKCCDGNKLTDIEISNISHLEEAFFDIPQVFNAKNITVGSVFIETTAEGTFKVTMKWLEVNRNRPEAGKELGIWCFSNPIPKIIEELGDSIVRRHPTNQAIRVTTSDPSLHIWIHSSSRDSCLQMFIVPSDSEDPDFRKMDAERLGPSFLNSDDDNDDVEW